MPRASQPGDKVGLRLRFSHGHSHALPTTGPPPTISSSLALELPQRVVSTPLWEAFKQLLERQSLAWPPGSLAGCEVGQWVDPSSCEHAALQVPGALLPVGFPGSLGSASSGEEAELRPVGRRQKRGERSERAVGSCPVLRPLRPLSLCPFWQSLGCRPHASAVPIPPNPPNL